MKGRGIILLVCEGYSEKTKYFTMLMKPLKMDKACNYISSKFMLIRGQDTWDEYTYGKAFIFHLSAITAK